MTQRDTGFLAGVIEGFYGQPWTDSERLELFDSDGGLRPRHLCLRGQG